MRHRTRTCLLRRGISIQGTRGGWECLRGGQGETGCRVAVRRGRRGKLLGGRFYFCQPTITTLHTKALTARTNPPDSRRKCRNGHWALFLHQDAFRAFISTLGQKHSMSISACASKPGRTHPPSSHRAHGSVPLLPGLQASFCCLQRVQALAKRPDDAMSLLFPGPALPAPFPSLSLCLRAMACGVTLCLLCEDADMGVWDMSARLIARKRFRVGLTCRTMWRSMVGPRETPDCRCRWGSEGLLGCLLYRYRSEPIRQRVY